MTAPTASSANCSSSPAPASTAPSDAGTVSPAEGTHGPVARPACYTVVASPVGDLTLTADEVGLTGCWFEGHRRADGAAADLVRDDAPFAAAVDQLDAYFAGRLQNFDLALHPVGTDFRLRVWAGLRTIGYGATRSYGELAASIGSPNGFRAVGLANGANPLSIIVPCHRVIGADGSLTGYGGGVERKRFLLDLEQGTPSLV